MKNYKTDRTKTCLQNKTARKENIRRTAILLLYILHERLNKNSIFSHIYGTNISNCTSLQLFTFNFISVLPLYKHLFKLVMEQIYLFVLEHAVHTFFEIHFTKNQTTQRHILEESNLPSRCHENLKCHRETRVPADNSNQIPQSL
jgi:hypothetical protein